MANMHTARIAFPGERTPSPDFDLDITNRTVFDADYEDHHNEQAPDNPPDNAHNPAAGRPAHFPFISAADAGEAKMPRPKGSQGKQWSLSRTLAWDGRSYKIVQGELHEIHERAFDSGKTYDSQTTEAKEKYTEEALRRFPFLGDYPNAWPATEFAWLYLKNASATAGKNKRRKWKP